MKTVALAEVTDTIKTWNPARAPEAEFDYIDLSAVDNASKGITNTTVTIGKDAPSRARQLVCAGDVLVSTVRPNLNAVAVVPPELDGATASTGFAVLRPSPNLSSRYLFHWVRSSNFISEMVRKATGASYPAVSDRIVKESRIPAPSPAEQQRIAAILDQADTLRTKRRQVIEHLDGLAEAIFQEMFGSLTPDRTLGDVADVQGGLQVSSKRKDLPVEVPYLRVANVHRGRLDLSEVKTLRATPTEVKRTTLAVGDLLVVEGHANPLEIGRVATWMGEVGGCVHQNHLIRARLDTSRAVPTFASAWFNTDRGAAHFRRAGRTTSGLNTISASTVRSAPLPLPSLDRQQEFARRVRCVAEQRTVDEKAAHATNELFVALQSRAFRGEL